MWPFGGHLKIPKFRTGGSFINVFVIERLSGGPLCPTSRWKKCPPRQGSADILTLGSVGYPRSKLDQIMLKICDSAEYSASHKTDIFSLERQSVAVASLRQAPGTVFDTQNAIFAIIWIHISSFDNSLFFANSRNMKRLRFWLFD